MVTQNGNKNLKIRTAAYFAIIIALVVVLSAISSRIWGGKPEQLPIPKKFILEREMTVGGFGQANGLSGQALKEIFGLKTRSDLEKKLSEYGTDDQVASMVNKKLALASEHASKNWVKIPLKFGLWFIFLLIVFILQRKRKIVTGLRIGLLTASVLIFGVVMGSDPSPMGTVKDAIHLYGKARAVFPPRVIALSIFLAIVLIANKFICAWGCQAGTLQDLIFRTNQAGRQKAAIGRQVKLPFAVTNSIRVAFFCALTIAAFAWGFDIIDPIDPFKIFKPAQLGIIGASFVGMLLLASLFIYRPWCHLFCPFGLTGWLVEKISLVRIKVDYETCIACQKCAAACPSTVMGAILKRDKKTIPDCFACYACREACPTNSISFAAGKRTLPPAGHFKPLPSQEGRRASEGPVSDGDRTLP
ncbi:MAG TPA: 4Fe-4S binding protein [Syntrophorhabdaceae bacterium]|nr:4Fe-4S binding protein [Syntrophorhabdaceae bacterium]